MVSNGKSIDGVVSQLNNNLSKEYLDYLLDWTEIGANLSAHLNDIIVIYFLTNLLKLLPSYLNIQELRQT